ncbi:ATPase, partial [Vibrio anguillarum]|nr:ATPase [Vibrio anguillarum]
MVGDLSADCLHVLKLLARSKNVLIAGAPGTGKSRLLGEV